jgi:hypothetical protein
MSKLGCVTANQLRKLGVNVDLQLLKRRMKAIKRILFRDEILRIEEKLFEARFHKI